MNEGRFVGLFNKKGTIKMLKLKKNKENVSHLLIFN